MLYFFQSVINNSLQFSNQLYITLSLKEIQQEIISIINQIYTKAQIKSLTCTINFKKAINIITNYIYSLCDSPKGITKEFINKNRKEIENVIKREIKPLSLDYNKNYYMQVAGEIINDKECLEKLIEKDNAMLEMKLKVKNEKYKQSKIRSDREVEKIKKGFKKGIQM